jgi:hypothetical protein
MKWFDTRTKKPPATGYNVYVVVFKMSPSFNHTSIGFCGYMPNSDYTDGSWQEPMSTNMNNVGGEVLYWMPYPQKPEDVI